MRRERCSVRRLLPGISGGIDIFGGTMAKKQRRLFAVETPMGYRVVLTRDRWRQIVRHKHPALAGHEKDVRACLESPALVRESVKDPDVHLYYVPSDDVYLC